MIRINKNKVASFRYVMKNAKNEVLEDTRMSMATAYLHGSNGIQACLQNQLEGLVAGDKKVVYLSKSSGLTDDDFTFEVIVDEVRDALPEELLLGYPVLPPVGHCEEDCVCYKNV